MNELALKSSNIHSLIQALASELSQLSSGDRAQFIQELQHALPQIQFLKEDQVLDSLPEENPNPVLRLTSGGVLLYFNRAALQLFTTTPQLNQLAPSFFQDLAIQASSTNQRATIDFIQNGRVFLLDIVPIAKSRHVNIYGRDMTLSRKMEAEREALLAENQRQQSLLDAVFASDPSGIAVLLGPDLRIVFANPAYRFICPPSKHGLIGMPYEEVWKSQQQDCYSALLREVLGAGRPFQTLGFERHFPDGTARIFTLQARRIYWGDQPAVLLALWDTTEQILSETKFRDLAESITDNFVAYDKNLRCIYRNSSSQKVAPGSPENMLGKTFTELFPEYAGSSLHQAYLRCLQTRQPQRLETTWVRPQDGQQLYFDVNVYPTREGIAALSKDITAQKQAAAAVARSNERIVAILGSITDCCYTLDPDWCFTLVNDPALAYFRKTREQLIGHAFWEVFPQVLGTPVEENYRKAAQGQVPVHYEILSPITQRWVEVHIYPSTEGLFAILRDITERKQIEMTIDYQAFLLDNVPDPIIGTDDKLAITYWNKAAEQLYGWKAEEVLGRKPGDVLHNEFNQEQRAQALAQMAHSGSFTTEVLTTLRDGRRLVISAKNFPLRDAQGVITGYVSINHDITEQT
jgi:PAS domain S-box-containing protein